jgi:hypothetical protein
MSDFYNDPNGINSNSLHDLIKASYKRNNTAEDIAMKHGYRLDHELSNSENKVFVNPDNQSSTVVYAGSRKAGDFLITDPAITLGLGKYTKRYKDSQNIIHRAKEKYGNEINTVGQSLGGWLSENVKGVKHKYTVNKLAGIGDIGKTISKNQTDIVVENDIPSLLSKTQKHKGKYIKIKNNSYNPVEAHNYKHLKKINI